MNDYDDGIRGQEITWIETGCGYEAYGEDDEVFECTYEGPVDAWLEGYIVSWTCPECTAEHEENYL